MAIVTGRIKQFVFAVIKLLRTTSKIWKIKWKKLNSSPILKVDSSTKNFKEKKSALFFKKDHSSPILKVDIDWWIKHKKIWKKNFFTLF